MGSQLPIRGDIDWDELEKNYKVKDITSPSCSNNVSQPMESPTVVTNSTSDTDSSLIKPDAEILPALHKPDGGFKLQ